MFILSLLILDGAFWVTGRFANVSVRQLSVRQRPGTIRQRSYVTSYVSSPTTWDDSPTFLCHILCQFANVFKRSYDMFADNLKPVYQIKKIRLLKIYDNMNA